MEHIVLRNFGPVSNIDIDLKKINVFIGEQGAGKSTIAKLLSCCRDLYLYYLIANNGKKEHINHIFRIYGILQYLKPNTFIDYTYAGHWHLSYENGIFSLQHEQCNDEELKILTQNLVGNGLQDICVKVGHKPFEQFSEEEIKKFINNNFRIFSSHLRTSFYCPAERGIVGALSGAIASLTLSNIPLPQTLLEFLSFFEKARNEYETYEIPFLGLKYQYNNGKDTIIGDKYSIPLKYSSSGLQSVLPLLMVIDYCLDQGYFSSFTVEEPELNLFPSNQMHLLRVLIAKTNTEKYSYGSWTMTTHSPYLLSVLNISLLTGIIADKFPNEFNYNNLINKDYIIRPNEIAVYSLNPNQDSYCTNIIDSSTGLIQANYLDSVSDTISAEFNELYRFYLSLIKASRTNK